MKLFLKGERCYTDKCALERRPYPPGQHGQARARKLTEYGEQLREKQKVKRIYGMLERQFRGYFDKAVAHEGRHRREPAPAPRAAPRQRRLPAGLRRRPRRGAPAGAPRALPGQRQAREHPVVPGAARTTSIEVRRRVAQGDRIIEALERGRAPRRAPLARARQGRASRARSRPCRPARTSRCRSTSSSSSSSTRSNSVPFAAAHLRAFVQPNPGRPKSSMETTSPQPTSLRAASDFMAKNWRDLIRPRTLDVEEKSGTYGKFTVRAARAWLRHHARQLAAARAAVVAAGRGHHRTSRSTARCTSSPRCRTWSRTSPTSSSTSRRSLLKVEHDRRPTPSASTRRVPGEVTARRHQLGDRRRGAQPRAPHLHAGQGRPARAWS